MISRPAFAEKSRKQIKTIKPSATILYTKIYLNDLLSNCSFLFSCIFVISVSVLKSRRRDIYIYFCNFVNDYLRWFYYELPVLG